jgi:hypothetical protein
MQRPRADRHCSHWVRWQFFPSPPTPRSQSSSSLWRNPSTVGGGLQAPCGSGPLYTTPALLLNRHCCDAPASSQAFVHPGGVTDNCELNSSIQSSSSGTSFRAWVAYEGSCGTALPADAPQPVGLAVLVRAFTPAPAQRFVDREPVGLLGELQADQRLLRRVVRALRIQHVEVAARAAPEQRLRQLEAA